MNLLGEITLDFDYKSIDSYFLHKENATIYIKSLQNTLPYHKEFFDEYKLIKDSRQNWDNDDGSLGMMLFSKGNIHEIINWERNYKVIYHANGNKKVEGGIVQRTKWYANDIPSGCNNNGQCWVGKVISYHENGEIRLISFYDGGEKEGLWTEYYDNNEIKSESIYISGKQISYKPFD